MCVSFRQALRSAGFALLAFGICSSQGATLISGRTGAASITANGPSAGVSLDTEGRRIAFASGASNLVTNDTNGTVFDVFVRDLVTGVTELVSLSHSGGGSGNGPSSDPQISANGRYLLFESRASDLVANDTNNAPDLFLRDLETRQTTLVSLAAADGGSGDGPSTLGILTPDGRHVAFLSKATNLVAGITVDPQTQVYLRDLDAGITRFASDSVRRVAPERPAVADDGSAVAFAAFGTSNAAGDVWVYSAAAGTTRAVSTNFARLLGTSESLIRSTTHPSFSPDGRWVAYKGEISIPLIPSKAVVMHDLTTAESILVSTAATPNLTGVTVTSDPVFSPDGRWLAHLRKAGNLSPVELWLRNREDQTDSLITTLTRTNPPDPAFSAAATFNADGRFITFASRAGGSSENPDGHTQIHLHEIATGASRLLSVGTNGVRGGSGPSWNPVVNADATRVAWFSSAPDLVAGDFNGFSDVFVATSNSLDGWTIEVVSKAHPGMDSRTGAGPSSISDQPIDVAGHHVVFSNPAPNLVPGDSNAASDVFLRNTETGALTLVSRTRDGASANGDSFQAVISPDGTRIAFASDASNLVEEDTNGVTDVFVVDRASGEIDLVSRASGSGPAVGRSFRPVFSPDGRMLLFESIATNLVSEIPLGGQNVFAVNLETGVIQLLSINAAGHGVNTGPSRVPRLASDNQRAFFQSEDRALTGATAQRALSLFRRDLPDGSTTSVDPAAGSVEPGYALDATGTQIAFTATYGPPNQPTRVTLAEPAAGSLRSIATNATQPSLSADGRWIAYSGAGSSPASPRQVYLQNLETGLTRNVSVNAENQEGLGGNSVEPLVGPEGQWVLFRSSATNLVANDSNDRADLLLWNGDGTPLLLVSAAVPGGSANDLTVRPVLNPAGSVVVFESYGSDLAEGDSNDSKDIFLLRLTETDGALRVLSLTGISSGQTTLIWSAIAGRTYQVEYTEDLEVSGWTLIPGDITATSDTATQTDPGAEGRPRRFYRVREVP